MASTSKSQSSKRKDASNKIKIQMNGNNATVIQEADKGDDISDDISSAEGSPKAVPVKGTNREQDDQDKKKKEVPARIDTSVLDNVTCTACGRQLNPYKNSSVHKHPELKLIICKKCDKFLSSGKIAKDGDGVDEQCRWCGEGGRLVVCDHCSCAFCKACVMRNFNRSEFNNINDQPNWECYICDKTQLQGLRENYRQVRDTMRALQVKEKERNQTNATKEAENSNGRSTKGKSVSSSGASSMSHSKGLAVKATSSVGSDSSSSSGHDIALSKQDLEVDFDNVDITMDKLSTATNTFREMLRALRSQFHTTSPRRSDEAPPLFQISLGSSLDTNAKKKRCAKALNSGLITYFACLRKILHTESETAASTGASPPPSSRSINQSSTSSDHIDCTEDLLDWEESSHSDLVKEKTPKKDAENPLSSTSLPAKGKAPVLSLNSRSSSRLFSKTKDSLSDGKIEKQSQLDKSKEESSSKNKDKDSADKSKDKASADISKDKASAGKGKDSADKSKDKDYADKRKDRDSMGKSKEKDLADKNKDKDSADKSKGKDLADKNKDKDSRAKSKDQSSADKSKDKGSVDKSKDKDSPAKGKDKDSPAKDKDSPAKGKDKDSPAKGKDKDSADKSKDKDSLERRKDKDSSERRKDKDSSERRKDKDSSERRKEDSSERRKEDSSERRKDRDSLEKRKDKDSSERRKDKDSSERRKDKDSSERRKDKGSLDVSTEKDSLSKDENSPDISKDNNSPDLSKEKDSQDENNEKDSPDKRKGKDSSGTNKEKESLSKSNQKISESKKMGDSDNENCSAVRNGEDIAAMDEDDENNAAKLDMIKQLADEMLESDNGISDNQDDDDGDADEMGGDSGNDITETPLAMSNSKSNVASDDEGTSEKDEVNAKKTNDNSSEDEETQNKGEEESNKKDASDMDSSSDALDSDDDDVDLLTKKKKMAKQKSKGEKKETEKPVAKNEKPVAKKPEPVVKAKRGRQAKAKPQDASASTSVSKPKAASNPKAKKKDNDEEDDDRDEIDKEIEKLSKLPSLKSKKQKPKKNVEEEKEEEEEADGKTENDETSAEKQMKRPRRGVKSTKEGVTLEDLSSDDEEEDENKIDSEEEDDDDDGLKVTFGVEEDVLSAEKDNLSAKNGLLEDIDDDKDDDDSSDEDKKDEDDSSDDDEGDTTKKSRKKKSETMKEDEEKDEDKDEEKDEDKDEEKDEDKDEEDSASENNIGKRKRSRNKLLDTKLSDSDSDVGTSKKKKADADEDADSFKDESSSGSSLESSNNEEEDSDDEEDEEDGEKKKGKKKKRKRKGKKKKGSEDEEEEEDGKAKKGKKRKRIKKTNDSSDEDNKEDDDDPDASGFGKRKKIRKVMSNKKLEDSTKAAARAEEKRRKRIAAKQREFNVETVTDENNPMNAPMTTKLVLEPGKEEGDDPIVQVNKKLIRKLKPHQVDAIQFMWDCLYESVKRSKKEDGAGCILAHCMGLGKTLSVISFVHTVLSHEKQLNQRTCLVVSPLNTVLNWRNEWSMWLEKKDQLEVWELASCKQNNLRADTLREWQESGGIMIIGYEMYRNLTTGARIKNKRLKKAFHECLVDPGPDLCICDEGHILKNENSSLSKAMNLMRTRRRVVLTGTPLQNNLNEYHCMLTFVKPKLLGTKKEFNNRFISPILNGQCTDSTTRDVRIMKARAHVLHEMLAGCVQRRDYSALTKFLPPKQEYVISVRLSSVQIELYEKYLELTGQGVDGVFNNKGARLFKDYQNLMKIWTHPWVLKLAEIRDELKMKYDDDEDSFIDDDNSEDDQSISSASSSESDEKISNSSDDEAPAKGHHSKKGTKRTRAKERRQAGEDSDPEEVISEWKTKMRKGEKADGDEIKNEPDRISREWWAQYVCEDDKSKIELGHKLFLLFEILRMCEEIGDKVLIFSQSILSLNIIEDFLETVDSKFQLEMDQLVDEKAEENPEEEKEVFGKSWTKHLDYYRMDGSTSAQNRQLWAESFNNVDNYRARLFLISTKAGGLGINLVAANRVIIFDASWNPSHDVQSIFRVYRFGQIKPCYIYRFLAQGTMEEKIYERQVTKLSLSQRVVDEHQIERHFSANDLRELYNFKPERWEEEGEHDTLALPKDPLLAEVLKTHRQCVVSFHEHDSLLENQIEQTLTEEEKKAAWEEYENEKKGIIVKGPGMGSMGRTASWPMMAAAQILSKEQIAATVHALRQQLPDLPEEMFHMHVQQALRRQVQMKQDEMRRVEMMRMQELTYLNMMQQQQQEMGVGGMGAQNMAPWMQIQHLRAMQNHLMQGRGYRMGATNSAAISNRADEAINLDESPSK